MSRLKKSQIGAALSSAPQREFLATCRVIGRQY
jgi:hypothetical protein